MKTIIKNGLAVLSITIALFASCTKKEINTYADPSQDATARQSPDAVAAATHHLGEMFGGGIIFYLDSTKNHGLIAATKDQSNGMKWYNGSYLVTGATGVNIGTGASNTTKIINKQGNTGKYAAKLCADLVSGGFSDWYLPSKKELNQLYKQRSKVPGLSATNYWSSTESDANNAFDQEFGGGFQFADDKSFTIHVRAVRSF